MFQLSYGDLRDDFPLAKEKKKEMTSLRISAQNGLTMQRCAYLSVQDSPPFCVSLTGPCTLHSCVGTASHCVWKLVVVISYILWN